MSEEQLFTQRDRRSAADTATLLRSIAADLETDTRFDFLAGTDLDVGVPTEMDVELEIDALPDDRTELEVELIWGVAAERDATDEPSDTPTTDSGSSDGRAEQASEAGDSQATFEVYRDRADEWRWRLVHDNGNIIADSGEGYSTRQNAEKGLRSVKKNAPGGDVRVEE